VKNHVWRPLWVVIALVAVILTARLFIVPEDFGVHDSGYMYGWYRQGNLAEWKAPPGKYRHDGECGQCHDERAGALASSPHAPIVCENCHGAAESHPEKPGKLTIDRSRALCLRCHTPLPYPSSDRSKIVGIDALEHNPGEECSMCHDPHHPNLEEM